MPTPRQGYVWSGSEWTPLGPTVNIAPTYVQSSAPSSPTTGEIWVDTSLAIPTIDSATLVTTNTAQDIYGQKNFLSSPGSGYYFLQLGKSSTASNNWHIGSEGDGNFRLYNGNLGSGIERFSIDSSGRTRLPSQPSFKAYASGGGQINDPANPTTLIFGDTSTYGGHNVGGHYNASTGVFTAPVAGRYMFAFNMLTNPAFSTTDPGFVVIYITLNGTNIHYMAHNHNQGWVMEGSAIILNMAASDYVFMKIVYGSGHYGIYSYFSGCLLG